VFFVISGFLITSILIKEYERRGAIDLRAFYIRRFFRIFPAAYACVTVLACVGGGRLGWADIASAYTYTVNYNPSRPWILGHLWSLSVEEQFYLLWPFLLARFFDRRRGVALAGLLVGPVARVLLKLGGFGSEALGSYFPCVADSMATGCLLAMYQPEMGFWTPRLGRVWNMGIALASASVPLWPSLAGRFGVVAYQLVGITVMNVGIAFGIDHCVRRRYALLNGPVMVWLGVLSYSLYLWQQPFLDRGSDAWYAAFPTNLALAVAVALVSYFCVERPFLWLRDRLSE
jgi:peptidoglycan/LPS O-acetylase OafA/YrhL